MTWKRGWRVRFGRLLSINSQVSFWPFLRFSHLFDKDDDAIIASSPCKGTYMKLLSTIFLLVLLFGFGGEMTFAQEQSTIPQDLLEVDRQRCMQGCVPGFGEATCKPLCDCTVKEFGKRLDFER